MSGQGADLLAEIKNEIELLRQYLPEQLGEKDLMELIDEAVSQTGASSLKDLGRVMGWLMPRVKGRADGSAVRRLVEQKLK